MRMCISQLEISSVIFYRMSAAHVGERYDKNKRTTEETEDDEG